MKPDTAIRRYQQRHIEIDLLPVPGGPGEWQHVLVIPAYRECPSILDALRHLSAAASPFLAILVLNRPDSDPDNSANQSLREAVRRLPGIEGVSGPCQLNRGSALLPFDTEAKLGPLPAEKAVGLARKLGCDLAWQCILRKVVTSRWIHCSDADARLPADYFQRTAGLSPDVVAATYPFVHVPGTDTACNTATALYELRLHHYVLGLEYAGSSYAHHSLGSALAVTADAYAKVRGFPQRAAGEDFYLLNKLAKVGPIVRLTGDCIELASRESDRVPYGTGPSVTRISSGDLSPAQFYHPRGFMALRAVLHYVAAYSRSPTVSLHGSLLASGLDPLLAAECEQVLKDMGLQAALDHCSGHSNNSAQFLRHFHQWLDAFRTLKFIHALRERALPQQTLTELDEWQPRLWPGDEAGTALQDLIHSHWGWTRQDPGRW